MATDTLKSTSITNLDSTPLIPNNSGQGGPGMMRTVNDHAVATAAAAVGSTYRLVRIPTGGCRFLRRRRAPFLQLRI